MGTAESLLYYEEEEEVEPVAPSTAEVTTSRNETSVKHSVPAVPPNALRRPQQHKRRQLPPVPPTTTAAADKTVSTLSGWIMGLPQSGKRTLLQRLRGKDPFSQNAPLQSTSSRTDVESAADRAAVVVPYQSPHTAWERIQLHVQVKESLSNDNSFPNFVVLLIQPNHPPDKVRNHLRKRIKQLLSKRDALDSSDMNFNLRPVCLCLLLNFRDAKPKSKKGAASSLPDQWISTSDVQSWTVETLQENQSPIEPDRLVLQCTSVSLLNCYGLNVLHHFIYQAYLQKKRFDLEATLNAVRQAQHESITTMAPPVIKYKEYTKLLKKPGGTTKLVSKTIPTAQSSSRSIFPRKEAENTQDVPAAGSQIAASVLKTTTISGSLTPSNGKDALEAFLASDDEQDHTVDKRQVAKKPSNNTNGWDDDDDENDFFYENVGKIAASFHDDDSERDDKGDTPRARTEVDEPTPMHLNEPQECQPSSSDKECTNELQNGEIERDERGIEQTCKRKDPNNEDVLTQEQRHPGEVSAMVDAIPDNLTNVVEPSQKEPKHNHTNVTEPSQKEPNHDVAEPPDFDSHVATHFPPQGDLSDDSEHSDEQCEEKATRLDSPTAQGRKEEEEEKSSGSIANVQEHIDPQVESESDDEDFVFTSTTVEDDDQSNGKSSEIEKSEHSAYMTDAVLANDSPNEDSAVVLVRDKSSEGKTMTSPPSDDEKIVQGDEQDTNPSSSPTIQTSTQQNSLSTNDAELDNQEDPSEGENVQSASKVVLPTDKGIPEKLNESPTEETSKGQTETVETRTYVPTLTKSAAADEEAKHQGGLSAAIVAAIAAAQAEAESMLQSQNAEDGIKLIKKQKKKKKEEKDGEKKKKKKKREKGQTDEE